MVGDLSFRVWGLKSSEALGVWAFNCGIRLCLVVLELLGLEFRA